MHGRDREAEANRFAAAFLMPRRAVIAQGLREATLDRVLAARKHWTVSAMAMTHRLHELHLLSDWNYRTTCVALARDGYRGAEPGGARPEVSQVATKVLASLRERNGVGELADHLGIGIDELSRHLFRLVPVAVEGGAETTPPRGRLQLGEGGLQHGGAADADRRRSRRRRRNRGIGRLLGWPDRRLDAVRSPTIGDMP